MRKRTISAGERLDGQIVEETRRARLQPMNDGSSKCSFVAIAGKSSSSESTRRMFAAPSGIQHGTSRASWPAAIVVGGDAGSRYFTTSNTDQHASALQPLSEKGIVVSAT
ncbi:hypothetical protein [Mesorhizobium silamurunense]|uniref:hypothetical protein n=1 Tax=Mesorhizobium silamurunense TaxID=499528 RepID=UPI00178301F4|nr:hypothetical protein [Mesorhizobium silamurunense]